MITPKTPAPHHKPQTHTHKKHKHHVDPATPDKTIRVIDGVSYKLIGPPDVDWSQYAKRSCNRCLGRGEVRYKVLEKIKAPAIVQCRCSVIRHEQAKASEAAAKSDEKNDLAPTP